MAMQYSAAQEAIIAHRKGHLQVVACAGSGKTETVAKRIATLLAEGVEPRSIVAFTFTDAAATALKARILRKVAEADPAAPLDRLSPMYVGTLHGFCLRFLQERVPRLATFDLFSEHRLVGLVVREYDTLGLGALGIADRTEAVRRFLKTADAVENEMLDLAALPAGPFREAFGQYRATLDRYHVLTFNQAIARTVEELERPEVFGPFHATLRHLVVDEFQDINPAQARLIRCLARDPVQLCVVGDDDQAIYQWRGSSVDFIRGFAAEFGAHTETLGTNRRSCPSIVKLSDQFARTIPDRLVKEIDATRDDLPRSVQRFVAPDARTEADQIAEAIEAMHVGGIAWRDVAVLLRAMTAAPPLLEALERRGIPYRCEGRSALLLQPDAELMAHLFAWLAGRTAFWNPRAQAEVPLDPTELCERARRHFGLLPAQHAALSKILGLLRAAVPTMEEADLVGIYYRLLRGLGVHTWDLDHPEVVRRLGSLARFSELLADYEAVVRRARKLLTRHNGRRVVAAGIAGGEDFLDQFAALLAYYAQDAYRDFTGEPDTEGDAVTLSTIHAAKGLEWPVVFVPCLSSKRFPSYFTAKQQPWLLPRDLFPAARYEGSDADERRLFYVAITRARDHLYLSTHARVTTQRVSPSPYFVETGGGGLAPGRSPLATPAALPPHHGANDDKPTFSFSKLGQYQTCGLQYRLRTNLGFQPSAARELGYGRAVHHVLRRVAEYVRTHRRLPAATDLDKIFDREFLLPYADDGTWQRMEARARTLVDSYLRDFPSDLYRVWEVERAFELHLPSANITGRADVILDREDGLPGGLALVDYKTRPVSADDATLDLQLKVYTAAARGEGYDVRAAWLHDLAAAAPHARHHVATDPPAVEAATATLDALAAGIRARRFLPVVGEHCRVCDVGLLCGHAPRG
jgi:DNA helicase-2/ATP-dependent DNA helicase PcrA